MSLTARPLLPVTGRSVELELTPDLEEGKEYTIRCTPLSGFRRYSAGREVDTSDFAGFDRARPAVASNGRLRLDMCFPQEDEYRIRVLIDAPGFIRPLPMAGSNRHSVNGI